jgi:hypothetical protein
MKPWMPNHTIDDPPKDPDVLRWFQALGPPPVGQVPPYLQAKVRARIAQEQARPKGFAWMPRLATPAWATALAVALLLSLGGHVWWGIRAFSSHPPGTRQTASTVPDNRSVTGRLSTYRFQVEMPRAKELGTLVAAHSTLREPPAAVGFTPQAARTTFFHMGTRYAEALAALQSGAVDIAAPRLDGLVRALATVQAPRLLAQYLREMQTLLQSQRYTGEELARFLALFEPLYEDAYVRTTTGEGWLLFRAGTWVENLSLAAAVGDPVALRQGGPALADVRRTLTQLQAPPEVLEALARLHRLVTAPTLTDQDLGTIRTLVQDLQGMLGG